MRQTAMTTVDWRDGFLFVGNQLLLDFLNTRPVSDGTRVELLPDFRAVSRWFQAAGLIDAAQAAKLQRRWQHSAEAHRFVAFLQRFREGLRKQVLVWERDGTVGPAAVGELNKLLSEQPMRIRLKPEPDGMSTEPYCEPRQPGDLVAPLAHAAAMLFADVAHTRVRQCDGCVLHFHDTSRKGTRRWCSMQLCGNRLKVAAYAARQRRQEGGTIRAEARSRRESKPRGL